MLTKPSAIPVSSADRVLAAARELLLDVPSGLTTARSPAPLDDILAILLSTRYRRSSLAPASQQKIRAYVERQMTDRLPIRCYVMVGGYKQARLSSAPHIDWAEVFNVRHMLRLACELAARYESGVELVWRFHTSILSQINNYSLSDFEVYAQEFDRLLAHYAQCLGDIPITMRIEYAGNPREGESYVGQLEPQLEQYERWFDGLGEHEQAQLIAKSWRNIKWEGREQWAGLNEHEKYDKAKRALLLDKAFLDNDPITSTPTCETGITIYSRAGGAHDRLQYGGCSASSVQFWAGEGVFEVRTERVVPVIMPYSSNTRIVREQIAIPDTTSIAPTLTHVFWYQDTGYTK